MRWIVWLVAVQACGATTAVDAVDSDDTEAAVDDTELDLPPPAAPKAYSGTTCPTIVVGANEAFASSGRDRAFTLRAPRRKKGAGVVFLWHGNGDTRENFDAYMGASAIADQLGAFVVVPDAIGASFGLDWAVPPNDPKLDATFFDDVLSCLAAQEELDLSRVFTAGFSAGALWSSWLVMHRSEHLAGAVIFSGGSDGSVGIGPKVNPYKTPTWDIPVVLTHGGTTDEVAVKFQPMVESMASQLAEDGSTAIVCAHAQGHTPPTGFAAWSWPFLDAQRYGQVPSPYANEQDPSGELPGSCNWY